MKIDKSELIKKTDLGQQGEWLSDETIIVDMGNKRIVSLPIIMPCVTKTEVCVCSSTLQNLRGKADLKAPGKAYRSDRVWLSRDMLGERIEKRNSVYRPLRQVTRYSINERE